MASITICNLDNYVKVRLWVQAVDNDRSMEKGARLTLYETFGLNRSPRNLTDIIRSHFGSANGIDLELPSRDSGGEPSIPGR